MQVFFCENCKKNFDEPSEGFTEPLEHFGYKFRENVSVCPGCGADDYSEGFECEACGRVYEDEDFLCNGYCKECILDEFDKDKNTAVVGAAYVSHTDGEQDFYLEYARERFLRESADFYRESESFVKLLTMAFKVRFFEGLNEKSYWNEREACLKSLAYYCLDDRDALAEFAAERIFPKSAGTGGNMKNFQFVKETHEYFLDGKKLMSVSEFIKPLSGGYGEGNEYLEAAFETAAERGVIGHKIIEMLLKGEDIEGEYPEEYESYTDGAKLFLSEHKITPIYIETPFYGETLGIAGTPDLICLFDGELAILDYKFVSQIQKAKTGAQLNAYCAICQENGIEVEKLYAVHFKESGDYTLYPVQIDRADTELLLTLRERQKRKHPRGCII